MTTDLANPKVLILCDYDALYAAIELKLSRLPDMQMIRVGTEPADWQVEQIRHEDCGLMIVATVSSSHDPMSILSRAALLDRVGETPVLIISEQPSRSESDDKITYLNFPFDLDQLTPTVRDILREGSSAG
jgi:hypothetical protein